jgi:hypothetical protein
VSARQATPTLLEELTRDFPEKMRLSVREALDRTRIQNPNDPIYELMIVLGIWAKYYERIPAAVKEAGDGLERKNTVMLGSLDTRVELLQKLAQAVQAAVDQLDGAPKAIVERFPIEALAGTIAAKLDARFQALPLTKLEADLRALDRAIKELVGNEGGTGLAAKVEAGVKSLEEAVKRLAGAGYVPDQWPRDVAFTFLGAALAGLAMWFAVVRPMQGQSEQLEEVTRAAYNAGYITRKAITGSLEGKPLIRVDGGNIEHSEKAKDGTVTIYLKKE